MSQYLRRADALPAAAEAADAGAGDAMRAAYPALWEYLAVQAWPDGKHRETATLLLLFEEGAWKGCLHDRDQRRVAWVTSVTLEGLLVRLEAGCEADDMDWRRKKPWKSVARGGSS